MEEEHIKQKVIQDELSRAYLDYSMSVIVSRALPDVRDGLKPVHRRILYAMWDTGLKSTGKFKKSAHVVGQTLAQFHPHGDMAVYDSMVRMAQDFSLRYPLIWGQGNFGSVDGDSAAAYRYTEAKLKKIAEELLNDIDKNTVDFRDNFDGSVQEPIVLPSKFPNMLVNGSAGIAVGMATNIPPHNLTEICNALIMMIENPEVSIDDLMTYVKGPDFPTGGMILGTRGIYEAFKTGRGKVKVRAKTEVQGRKIIVSEIPYQVNKTVLIEGIVELVKNKVIEGIRDIRDESDRRGMSLIILVKENANPEVVLNQLFKHSQLETTFGVNMLALNNNRPETLPLKRALELYLDHRRIVVTRRTQFELEKAEKRLHILDGLLVALQNIDKIIEFLKKSKDAVIAKQGLMASYKLSDEQAQAILEMRLQRLTGLEQDKIKTEHAELVKMVLEFKDILAKPQRVMLIIRDELIEMRDSYGDERRTMIMPGGDDEEVNGDMRSLIQKEDIVITMTNSGYIKQVPLDTYKQQHRGGKGIIGAATRDEEDIVEHLFITTNHHTLLVFTNLGRVHWLPAYQVPEGSRYGKGKNIVNLLELGEKEKVSTLLPVDGYSDSLFLMFATKNGTLKKTRLSAYSNERKGGINAINLKDDNELVQVRLTPGGLEMIMASQQGSAVRFNDKDVNEMGRNATGVRGMRLAPKDAVVGIEVVLPTGCLLTVTENGYGKRTQMDEYRLTKRGGKGVINIQTTERNGNVIGIKTVKDADEVILMSQNGVVLRTSAAEISMVGRNTQGVRLMKLDEKDKVVTLARVVSAVPHIEEEKEE